MIGQHGYRRRVGPVLAMPDTTAVPGVGMVGVVSRASGGGYSEFVHSVSNFITKKEGGPQRATERRRATPSAIDRTHQWACDLLHVCE
jgi:hypothetical protein